MVLRLNNPSPTTGRVEESMDARKKEYAKEYAKRKPWVIIRGYISARCNDPSNTSYIRYGARGVKCLITSDELKMLWFRDKAYLMKRPSIDRKENGNYTFNNCRFIELSLNSINGGKKTKGIKQASGQRFLLCQQRKLLWDIDKTISENADFLSMNYMACSKMKNRFGLVCRKAAKNGN